MPAAVSANITIGILFDIVFGATSGGVMEHLNGKDGKLLSSFDAMAATIDWLDAYRTSDPAIINLYADDAVLEGSGDTASKIIGRDAIERHWQERFRTHPVEELVDLDVKDNSVLIAYLVLGRTEKTLLIFDDAGEIVRSCCPC